MIGTFFPELSRWFCRVCRQRTSYKVQLYDDAEKLLFSQQLKTIYINLGDPHDAFFLCGTNQSGKLGKSSSQTHIEVLLMVLKDQTRLRAKMRWMHFIIMTRCQIYRLSITLRKLFVLILEVRIYIHHCTSTSKNRLWGCFIQSPHLWWITLTHPFYFPFTQKIIKISNCGVNVERHLFFFISERHISCHINHGNFISVSAASLYWCEWLLTSNLWPSVWVCVFVFVGLLYDHWWGLTWRYWLPQHWHTAKEPGDEKTDKPIKDRWAAWLEQVSVSVSWVGGGVGR